MGIDFSSLKMCLFIFLFIFKESQPSRREMVVISPPVNPDTIQVNIHIFIVIVS